MRTLALLLVAAAVAGCLDVLQDAGSAFRGDDAPSHLYAHTPFDVLPPQGNVTVHFVDVGQGDGIVVHLPDGVMVIDTGPWYGLAEQAVRDHLAAEGVTRLLALVVTHPDADHAGGCDEVLHAFDVAVVLHPGLAKDTATWRDCRDAADDEGAVVLTDRHLDPGHYLNLTRHASVRVLHLDRGDTSEPNEGGIVLRLDHGDVSFLLPGDIGCATEEEVLARGLPVNVDVLKVGHHGSRYSTCDPWLAATTPDVGVISVGDNTYGHPTSEVLARLADHGVDVYRTDIDGTITVTSDGATWTVGTDAADT